MYFSEVAQSSFSAEVNNMSNILGGNVKVLLSIRLDYLMKKTGMFVKIWRFLVLR